MPPTFPAFPVAPPQFVVNPLVNELPRLPSEYTRGTVLFAGTSAHHGEDFGDGTLVSTDIHDEYDFNCDGTADRLVVHQWTDGCRYFTLFLRDPKHPERYIAARDATEIVEMTGLAGKLGETSRVAQFEKAWQDRELRAEHPMDASITWRRRTSDAGVRIGDPIMVREDPWQVGAVNIYFDTNFSATHKPSAGCWPAEWIELELQTPDGYRGDALTSPSRKPAAVAVLESLPAAESLYADMQRRAEVAREDGVSWVPSWLFGELTECAVQAQQQLPSALRTHSAVLRRYVAGTANAHDARDAYDAATNIARNILVRISSCWQLPGDVGASMRDYAAWYVGAQYGFDIDMRQRLYEDLAHSTDNE